MLTRVMLSDTPVLCLKSPLKSLPSVLKSDGVIFIVMVSESLKPIYERISVPEACKNLEFFIDHSDGNIYLSNFSYDQLLLEVPVDAIMFREEKVEIFMGSKCLIASPDQVKSICKEEHFYERIAEDTTPEPLKKRKRVYRENRDSFSSHMSPELGVFSDGSISEHRSQANSPIIQDLEDSLIEDYDIHSNSYDITVYDNDDDNDELIAVIPPAKLILSSEIDNHDKTVINMKREIEEKYVLNEADPIIVLENNGQFEVVSGTKRALAYKSMQVESIRVSAISSAEKERVVLSKFLTSSRLTDQDTLKTIPIIFQLFEFLDVAPSSLTTWTNKEISMVFSEFLGKTTKLKFLFDICTLSDLCQSIKKLCESGINCSVHLCRDSLRKFRQNPQDVLTILATPLASEIEIRKMLSHVEPDVMFLMEQKKVDLTTASHLNLIYGHDPRFSLFIRGADFRCVNKKDQKAYIESRFELFKQKNNTEFSSLPKTTFEVATEHSNFDMVITSSEALSESILKKTRNVTVVLIGHSISSGSNYAMFLPDCLSSKSITGKLQNLLMLTFRIKQNDINLKDEEISSELRASGLIDKTLLSISDLIIFFKPRSYIFIDLGGFVTPAVVMSMVSVGSKVFVRDDISKRRLESFSEQTTNPSYPSSTSFS
ncbi:hypothetical protein CRE_21784 [Caenorhabditis remanei]|uniref:Uncharacterized protein n=1 Tax=Caenorhabditis remanei TaxID=31234 RepID=E3MEG0_CAERE|nr:hypothetical protein CRE_21784 [Caenorhabditis remanei]